MADLAADRTEEEGLDDSKAPLLEHLIELRQRLIYSAAAILVLFFACYYFAPQIYGFLVQPLADVLASTFASLSLSVVYFEDFPIQERSTAAARFLAHSIQPGG